MYVENNKVNHSFYLVVNFLQIINETPKYTSCLTSNSKQR